MATSFISPAAVYGEQMPHHMHDDELDCSEGTKLIVVHNIVFISDAHDPP